MDFFLQLQMIWTSFGRTLAVKKVKPLLAAQAPGQIL